MSSNAEASQEASEPPLEEDDALAGFRNTQKRKDIVAQLMVGLPVWKENATNEVLLDRNAHWTFTDNLMGSGKKSVSILAESIDGVAKRNISKRITAAPDELVFSTRRQNEKLLEQLSAPENRLPSAI